jgi:hypothetical protein
MLARFGKPSSSLGARRGLVYSLALVLALAARAATLSAAEPTSPQLFREQLDSGEFAPALQLAQQIDHRPERDAWLVQLAQAQAQAGARDAAFSSLSSVADDRIRGEAAQSTSKIAPPPGAFGGTQADFRSLIDLITSTVKPSTWDEVGGPGSVSEFRNGVYVDADGMLKRALQPRKAHGLAVARLDALNVGENTDTRRAAPLRKVSLTRLEKHVQLSLAAGRPLTDEMLAMAGLEKIKYVMVYPDLGDLVIAGPASDWRRDDEDRLVSRKSGRPVLQLDDLVVVLRYLTANPHATFGCSINPTEEGLARTKAFADRSSATPLKPGQRPEWLKTLRAQMGPQTIAIDGIDPHTRAARVLVEADYRMKLVGMGLEDGTIDVPSYLSLIQVAHGEAPPALDVLRWWFTLKYDAVHATDQRDAFELRGTGVQVMSENELLTSLGQQVHTGKSEPLNQEFAQRFTQHFAALAQKYPVYADLQNIFDLALMTALINSEHLAERVGWHMTCFGDPVQYHVAVGPAPQMVDTIINHRVVNQKHIIVGVSGGVRVEPWTFVSGDAIETDSYGKLDAERTTAAAKNLPLEAWWWD